MLGSCRVCFSLDDVSTRTMQIQLVGNTSPDACFPRFKASNHCFFLGVSRYCHVLWFVCFTGDFLLVISMT